MAKSLRSNEHKVIGSASSFPENVLPTKSDVVKRTQLSKDHLEFSTGKQKIPLEVPNYPCHTQAVERAIKLVSEASAAVVGQEAREGFISQQIKERQELSKFESKKDYFPKVEAACQPNDE